METMCIKSDKDKRNKKIIRSESCEEVARRDIIN